jgi:Tol biopolymer transport system component
MNADGTDQHQVGRLDGFMPTWSPDGKQIAFISLGNLVHPYGKEILRANADGSNVRRVARLGAGFPARLPQRDRLARPLGRHPRL